MPPEYAVRVIQIRLGSETDRPAIAQVMRASWHAAYAGIIPEPIIERATASGGTAANPPPYRRTLVAEAGEAPAVIGYASFGPERFVATAQPPPNPADGQPPAPAARAAADAAPATADPPPPVAPRTLTAEGQAGVVGELYAIYVSPASWSTGAGRALMEAVLTSLKADGYPRVVLWVLAENARARKFYERAGFTPDGATNILAGLGGVLEVRYARDL
jgi:ribosomal protein S18 acetylase RimI-like enzyme